MYQDLDIPGAHLARKYSSVSSTMDVARETISTAVITDSWRGLIVTDEQTAGRGRQGRSWLSSQGGFMGTFLFGTSAPVASLVGYSLAVGVAIAEVLATFGGDPRLKWPNDLMAQEGRHLKKFGGILIEVEDLGAYRCVLVGLGLNVDERPTELSLETASLKTVCQRSVTRDQLIAPLARALGVGHEQFIKEGLSSFLGRWRRFSCFRPRETQLEVDIGEARLSGSYVDVTDGGALVLDVDGARKVLHSGHIVRIF